jgi:hypothetical protein
MARAEMALPVLCRNPACAHDLAAHTHYVSSGRDNCALCDCPWYHGPTEWGLWIAVVLGCLVFAGLIIGVFALFGAHW